MSVVYADIPSRPDIEALKASWKADPSWDLEDTTGYEAYRDELRDFRLKTEAQWVRETRERHLALAELLGVPGNQQLAARWEALDNSVQALRDALAARDGQERSASPAAPR